MPMFSVVIPVYKDYSNVINSIRSVLAQTYKDFEIIVVDDASNDGTFELLNKDFSEYRNVHIMRHLDNKGPGSARNSGIKCAKGEYIAFLDSDDLWCPQFLQVFHDKIKKSNHGVGFYFCNGHIFKEGNLIGKFSRASWVDYAAKGYLYKRLYLGNFIATQGVVVKRSVLVEAGGFDESLRSAQDHDLWLRLSLKTRFCFIDQPLFQYNVRENTVTSNLQRRLNCQLSILRKHDLNIRSIAGNWFKYILIKRHALSNIYITASWDVLHRGGSRLKALWLALKAVALFPGPGACYYLVRLSLGL